MRNPRARRIIGAATLLAGAMVFADILAGARIATVPFALGVLLVAGGAHALLHARDCQ